MFVGVSLFYGVTCGTLKLWHPILYNYVTTICKFEMVLVVH